MAGGSEGQLVFGEGFAGDVDDAPLTPVPVVAEPLLDLAPGEASHLDEPVDLSVVRELALQEARLQVRYLLLGLLAIAGRGQRGVGRLGWGLWHLSDVGALGLWGSLGSHQRSLLAVVGHASHSERDGGAGDGCWPAGHLSQHQAGLAEDLARESRVEDGLCCLGGGQLSRQHGDRRGHGLDGAIEHLLAGLLHLLRGPANAVL